MSQVGLSPHLVGTWGLGPCLRPTQAGFESFSGYLEGGADKFRHKLGNKNNFYYNQNEDTTGGDYSTRNHLKHNITSATQHFNISVVGNYSTEVLVSRAGSVVTNFMAQRLLSSVDLGACIEYNTDYTGNNIRDGAMPGVDNFKDCQNLCFLRPDCNFWSWNPPSFATDRLLCQLKSSDEGRSLPSGKISGPKSCSGSLASGGDTELLMVVAFEVPGPPLQVPLSYQDVYSKVRDEKRKKHLGECRESFQNLPL